MNSLSIITICFNNVEDLKKTCESVDKQKQLPLEQLIINGSTNDDIKNWYLSTPQPSYRKIINEHDKGIYDAFNKGIKLCKGTITHLLNSGDIYANENVTAIATDAFNNNATIKWISGNIIIHRAGSWFTIGKPFDKNQVYKGMRSIAHPTWFVKSEVYQKIGYYHNFKIGMDYDMMCRIKEVPYQYIDATFVQFDNTGISSNNYLRSLKENIIVYETNFGFSIKCRIWQFRLKLIYYLMQTKIGKMLYKLKEKVKHY